MPMSRDIARAFMWGIIEIPPEPKPAPAELTEEEREKVRKVFNVDESDQG